MDWTSFLGFSTFGASLHGIRTRLQRGLHQLSRSSQSFLGDATLSRNATLLGDAYPHLRPGFPSQVYTQGHFLPRPAVGCPAIIT